jgi:hypothetical protein
LLNPLPARRLRRPPIGHSTAAFADVGELLGHDKARNDGGSWAESGKSRRRAGRKGLTNL